MVFQVTGLTQGDIEEINLKVWVEKGKYGYLDIPPIKIEMQRDTPPIRVRPNIPRM